MRNKLFMAFLVVLLIFASPALAADIPAQQDIKVHFIDVGQADSIYIQLPGNQDILIDGGNMADGPLVVNYLKAQGVDDIELLIATHPHEDHIGGLPVVFDAFVVEKVIDSGYFATSQISKLYQDKAKAEQAVYEADNYQTLTFGNATLQILTGNEVWKDTNDYSVVCRLDTGDIEFLFTGDAEAPVEMFLNGELDAEILKVGHHGSSSSTTADFLAKVKPQIGIISVGAGNTYGHPNIDTLQRLQAAGVTAYRTDQSGTIVVKTDGKTYSMTTERTGITPVPVAPIPSPVVQQAAPVPAQSTGKYVGSSTSNKYHYPDCRHAKTIQDGNKVWFKDTADAKVKGYVPCGVCKP
ncbi:ComEC/Rec2 family competence protein [Desulforamulus hydrothermalis]|uniref:Metallo-beta-lactamase domain-containing protein n=1 Tax=Desulforamulus hydrothermalis Lam5 = DSM 18033 TaxID=1121428 RepID=K8E9N0_9FIRM|nr:ComEC/Rec2 family competence protein [Desulforamulus hydrothermalis]CCO08288.1 conserved exported hypothetical protein [Desulforamulus hydrothermalis Lam5 = DSM 18033]SHH37789.1 Metal-dependent hydrolase, beta-lactamase superfamily II [Desulforamulus hydrothermalis Lam5 = DSM 18033]